MTFSGRNPNEKKDMNLEDKTLNEKQILNIFKQTIDSKRKSKSIDKSILKHLQQQGLSQAEVTNQSKKNQMILQMTSMAGGMQVTDEVILKKKNGKYIVLSAKRQ